MAERTPTITFEDIPLEEARRMSRGPWMDPELYHALREKISSLRSTAARMTLPGGTNPTTMKNRVLRVATELKIPVTIRRVSGGLLFWRSAAEDLRQAKEVVQRLQRDQHRGGTRRSRGRASWGASSPPAEDLER